MYLNAQTSGLYTLKYTTGQQVLENINHSNDYNGKQDIVPAFNIN